MEMGDFMTEKEIIRDRSFLSSINFWPNSLLVDPAGWLTNFDDSDRSIARELLDSFTYFNSLQVQKLISTGFMRLSSRGLDESNVSTLEERWAKFLDTVVISYPVSMPVANPSDSGHMFVRVLRDQFHIPDTRILEPKRLHAILVDAKQPFPIVFVDDFSGTGNQFIRTIQADFSSASGRTSTIDDEVGRLGSEQAFCVSAVITASGHSKINTSTNFIVSGGNVLPPSASILDAETHLVSKANRPHVQGFVKRYSRVAGIPRAQAFGYRRSGLAIAFEHGTPNNSVPLFYWKENGWKPLIRRP